MSAVAAMIAFVVIAHQKNVMNASFFLSAFRLAGFFSLLITVAGCKFDRGGQENAVVVVASAPSFQRDTAFAYIEAQLAFGPRAPGTEAHAACGRWLAEELRALSADVVEQRFTAKGYTGITYQGLNIIGQYNPSAGKRILLAAHWDSRHTADSPLFFGDQNQPVPGADDGASGVAVLLEIARILRDNPVDIGVDIVFFDLEDQGETGAENPESWGLGAQYWSRNPHRAGYQAKYGILLDMVGAKDARFPKEYWSQRFARELVDKVWKLARNLGYGNFFVETDGGAVTDDHYFVNTIAGIKMINIINRPAQSETGFGHYWHTPDDDIGVIDRRTLRAVGQVVLTVVYRENSGTF
jgi:glutaminyl-peptide cyclotransferase